MGNRIVFRNKFIDFDLEKSVTVYSNCHAFGKTYLQRYVSRFKDFPIIFSIYNTPGYERFVYNPWPLGGSAIYFMDRFDIFVNNEILDILEKSRNICCLLDCRHYSPLLQTEMKFKSATITRKYVNFVEVKNE